MDAQQWITRTQVQRALNFMLSLWMRTVYFSGILPENFPHLDLTTPEGRQTAQVRLAEFPIGVCFDDNVWIGLVKGRGHRYNPLSPKLLQSLTPLVDHVAHVQQ
jgi:hypothetical protein